MDRPREVQGAPVRANRLPRVGLLVVALLGVATYFLIRSMNRQIGRIDLPDETDEANETDDADGPPTAKRDPDRHDRPGPDEPGLSPR